MYEWVVDGRKNMWVFQYLDEEVYSMDGHAVKYMGEWIDS